MSDKLPRGVTRAMLVRAFGVAVDGLDVFHVLRLQSALSIAAVELPAKLRSAALDKLIADTRARNALIRNGVKTVAALLKLHPIALRSLRGIGPATCQKLADALTAAIVKTGAPAGDLKTYLAWKQARLRELEQRLAQESYRRRELERGRP